MNKPTDQRIALLRNLSYSLIQNRKVTTTTLRAKQVKKFIEKLITISRTDSVHSRRLVAKNLNNKNFVKKIFEASISYIDRDGGYIRLTKVSPMLLRVLY